MLALIVLKRTAMNERYRYGSKVRIVYAFMSAINRISWALKLRFIVTLKHALFVRQQLCIIKLSSASSGLLMQIKVIHKQTWVTKLTRPSFYRFIRSWSACIINYRYEDRKNQLRVKRRHILVQFERYWLLLPKYPDEHYRETNSWASRRCVWRYCFQSGFAIVKF